jgi:putative transposase
MIIPDRKSLPHDVPLWVDPSKSHYFITVNCRIRGKNQLANAPTANGIVETVKHRNAKSIWHAHLVMIMPDHVHLVLSFPISETKIKTIMSKWKQWTAKALKINWQRDFFEHRLRKEESFREKADYILANPVRAGLVEKAEDWPYVFIAEPW